MNPQPTRELEMNGEQRNQATATLEEPATVTCSHCLGQGECVCALCWPSPDAGMDCNDFDTGRQDEGTCRFCKGLGETFANGEPLIPESFE